MDAINKNDRKDPKTIAALVNEGRFSYPYIPTGIYAEIRSLSNLRFQTQEELTRIKNRIARWFSIYFPEYKDVYGDLKAVSGRMVLKAAPLFQLWMQFLRSVCYNSFQIPLCSIRFLLTGKVSNLILL